MFYQCLEGECQEHHSSHTGDNENHLTRAMFPSSLHCITNFGNLNPYDKPFAGSQTLNNTIIFNMYSMMLSAQEVAPTPVAEGTSLIRVVYCQSIAQPASQTF